MRNLSAPHRTVFIIQAVLLACLVGQESAIGAEVMIDLNLRTIPENVAIFEGDTIVFRCGDRSDSTAAHGYAQPWQTPLLGPGKKYELGFLEPGTHLYLVGTYSPDGSLVGEFAASINVEPLTNAHPAITLVSPPAGFAVPGLGVLQAAVTNAESQIQLVQFFDRGKLIGMATNAPYRLNFGPSDPSILPRAYVFTAQAINKDGSTNVSPPIVVQDQRALIFDPTLLPDGVVAFFYSMEALPNCVFRASDLVDWNVVLGFKGDSTFIDDSRTNAPVRIYQVRGCL